MRKDRKMKRILAGFAIVAVFSLSCEEKKEKQVDPDPFEAEFEKLQANNLDWWTYHNRNVDLSSEFSPLNEKDKEISKKAFLEQLTTGKFIPMNINSSDSASTYKLYRLTTEAAREISPIIKNTSQIEFRHFLMEGQKLPKFQFKDLQGNSITSENTKGKNLIVKTWFINCKPCIAEMPDLNEFVEAHGEKEDLLFLSLALDSEEDLKKFLSEKEFKYAVVPNQESYIQDSLKLSVYPTHLVVDKNGVIQKVINKADKMMAFVDQKIYEPVMEKTAAPPPPPPPPGG